MCISQTAVTTLYIYFYILLFYLTLYLMSHVISQFLFHNITFSKYITIYSKTPLMVNI